LPKGDDYPIFF